MYFTGLLNSLIVLVHPKTQSVTFGYSPDRVRDGGLGFCLHFTVINVKN